MKGKNMLNDEACAHKLHSQYVKLKFIKKIPLISINSGSHTKKYNEITPTFKLG